MMEKITVITGTMAPLPLSQVDTDQIVPKQFLKRVERSGFGKYLFHDWARDASGELDPDFVLNRHEYRTATVLVAGPDFGTGSSREHAPWALADWGFQAVIAPSFGDIFVSNCLKIGLLPVALPGATVEQLLGLASDDPDAEVTIDLEAQTITASGVSEHFEVDAFAKHMLRNGLDEIALTLQHEVAIEEHESERPSFLPKIS